MFVISPSGKFFILWKYLLHFFSITFIFNSYHRSWAATTPFKYERGIPKLTGFSTMLEKWDKTGTQEIGLKPPPQFPVTLISQGFSKYNITLNTKLDLCFTLVLIAPKAISRYTKPCSNQTPSYHPAMYSLALYPWLRSGCTKLHVLITYSTRWRH